MSQIEICGMKRKEKFRYLKAKGFKVKANMTNDQLDALCKMDEPPAEQPSIRGAREGKKRVPLGKHRSKLSIESLNIPKDKVPRWVNDKGGRIRDALDGGYEFVNDPDAEVGEENINARLPGAAVSRQVGTKEDGSPLTAYLMVIDKDLYDQDQKDKMQDVDMVDDSIKRGLHESQFEDGKYIPKEGIKYNPRG